MLNIICILCLLGWFALFVAPLSHHRCWVFARSCAVIAAVTCTLHCLIAVTQHGLAIFAQWHEFKEFFKSTLGLSIVFEIALVFQLFFGTWQVEDSNRSMISHRRLLPFLLLVCVLPPLGLFAHMMMRDWQKIKISRGKI